MKTPIEVALRIKTAVNAKKSARLPRRGAPNQSVMRSAGRRATSPITRVGKVLAMKISGVVSGVTVSCSIVPCSFSRTIEAAG